MVRVVHICDSLLEGFATTRPAPTPQGSDMWSPTLPMTSTSSLPTRSYLRISIDQCTMALNVVASLFCNLCYTLEYHKILHISRPPTTPGVCADAVRPWHGVQARVGGRWDPCFAKPSYHTLRLINPLQWTITTSLHCWSTLGNTHSLGLHTWEYVGCLSTRLPCSSFCVKAAPLLPLHFPFLPGSSWISWGALDLQCGHSPALDLQGSPHFSISTLPLRGAAPPSEHLRTVF